MPQLIVPFFDVHVKSKRIPGQSIFLPFIDMKRSSVFSLFMKDNCPSLKYFDFFSNKASIDCVFSHMFKLPQLWRFWRQETGELWNSVPLENKMITAHVKLFYIHPILPGIVSIARALLRRIYV